MSASGVLAGTQFQRTHGMSFCGGFVNVPAVNCVTGLMAACEPTTLGTPFATAGAFAEAGIPGASSAAARAKLVKTAGRLLPARGEFERPPRRRSESLTWFLLLDAECRSPPSLLRGTSSVPHLPSLLRCADARHPHAPNAAASLCDPRCGRQRRFETKRTRAQPDRTVQSPGAREACKCGRSALAFRAMLGSGTSQWSWGCDARTSGIGSGGSGGSRNC